MINFKKFLAGIACSLVIVAASVAPAFAANTKDQDFNFRLPNAGYYTVILSGQRKDNTTSVYVYYMSGPAKYTRFSGHGGYNERTAVRNCTVGDSAIINVGTKRRLRTNIKEWGYSHAFIGGCNNTYPNRNISGKWSPDCAGTYPYAN